jgi:hypothetical protein
MTVPMWKGKTIMTKTPEHYQDVFACKFYEAAKAESVPMSEVGILANIAPTVRY